jgi:hypothetical protein
VRKVSAHRTEVSRKNRPNGLLLKHLLWYADDGEDMGMNQSMLQGNGNIPVHLHEKFKVMQLARKIMLTMFWYSQGVLLAPFQKHGKNVNSASYCEVLLKLWDAVHKKHPGNCFIMTMPDPIQPEQPRRDFKKYSGNFLNIHLTAWTPQVTSTCCSAKKASWRQTFY